MLEVVCSSIPPGKKNRTKLAFSLTCHTPAKCTMSAQIKEPGSHPARKGKSDMELIVGLNQPAISKPLSAVDAESLGKVVGPSNANVKRKLTSFKKRPSTVVRHKALSKSGSGDSSSSVSNSDVMSKHGKKPRPKQIADSFVVLHCGYAFPLLDEANCQKELEKTYLDVISGKLDGDTFNVWMRQNLEFTRNVALPDECSACKKRTFVLCGAHALHAKCFFTVLEEEEVQVEEIDRLIDRFVRLQGFPTVGLTAEKVTESQQRAIDDIFNSFFDDVPVDSTDIKRTEDKCEKIESAGEVGPVSKPDVLVDLIDLNNDVRVYTVEDAVKVAAYDTSFNVQEAINRNKSMKDENRVDMLEKGISAFRQVDKVRKSKFTKDQCPTNTIFASGTVATCQPEPKVVLKPTWFRRIIFNEKPSEFLMHSNAQHRIGELREKKQELGRNIFDDSFLDVELFNFLRVSAFTKYTGRAEKLEHFNKLAQKYYLDNKIVLNTAYLVNLSKVTIQKATDSITDDFLLDAVDPEEPRKQRFTVDWLKAKVGLKRRVEHHFF